MTFEPWGLSSAAPAIFTVQLVLLKRCSTEYSAGITANMELDDFGVCFFLSSLFYLWLDLLHADHPLKSLHAGFHYCSCDYSLGNPAAIRAVGIFLDMAFCFRFVYCYLPTYVPAH